MTRYRRYSGFTLIELSVVLLIIGLVTAMGISSGFMVIESTRDRATRNKLNVIEQALQQYRILADRLPCPASLTIAEGASNFGVEAASPGTCTGGTPAANFSASGAVEGTIPVTTLGLSNDFMYDGWGKRFRYAVDKTMTAAAAFTGTPTGCVSGTITVNDKNGTARTTGAIYALISHGENGHGGYSKQGVIASSSSSNTDEQTNCHCNASAATTTYSPTYVQKDSTLNPSSATDVFDDLVSYKERWQMITAVDVPRKCGLLYVLDAGNNRVQKFTSTGSFISKWGSNGSGSGQFSNPKTITVDSSGNVYVVDTGNQRVQKFDGDGNFLLQLGCVSGSCAYGTGNGQFLEPYGVTVDSSGNIYVAELYGQRVQKFSSNGTYLSQFSTTAESACITLHNNYLYVCKQGGKKIDKYTTAGSLVTSYPFNGNVIPTTSIGFDSSDNMYVPDGNYWAIRKTDSNGTILTSFSTYGTGDGQVSGNQNVTVDNNDNIWTVDPDGGRVEKYNSSGTYLSQFGSTGSGNGQFNQPQGIAFFQP